MPRALTTTSCRAFALATLLFAPSTVRAAEADKVVPPKLPIALAWSIDLDEGPSAPPVIDRDRVYVALRSAHLVAYDIHDSSKQVWRVDRTVTSPMATADGVLFISAGNAVEALRGTDGKGVWLAPRITTTAPVVVAGKWILAVTDTEVLAIDAKDGRVAWRRAAGGVTLAPAADADRVYVGANDGRVLALALDTGEVAWETYLEDGITALAAHGGRVYAGAGDKNFYCLEAKKGKVRWSMRIGSIVIGPISVDDEQVYFTARDNVVRGLDRNTGVQHWQQPIRNRAFAGVSAEGHVVFVPVAAAQLPMLYDRDGRPSGILNLPSDALQDFPPFVHDTPDGLQLIVATGGLSNQWQLSLFASAGELPLVPVSDFLPDAGAYLLTDPLAEPLGKVMGSLVFGDPQLTPLSLMDWPIVLTDPPLEPLTTLPGLQLRELSPQLPPRREGSGPAG